jgi:hypothetical protein
MRYKGKKKQTKEQNPIQLRNKNPIKEFIKKRKTLLKTNLVSNRPSAMRVFNGC